MSPNQAFEQAIRSINIDISLGHKKYARTNDLLNGILRLFDYSPIRFNSEALAWDELESSSLPVSAKFYLHSLAWTDLLTTQPSDGSSIDAKTINLAESIAHTWWNKFLDNRERWLADEYIFGGHGVALRTNALLDILEHFPLSAWITDALQIHEDLLIESFDGLWNHGLAQSLALSRMADKFSHSEEYKIGVKRTLDCILEIIDDEGCINEQAPEYAVYIEKLLSAAIKFFEYKQLEEVGVLSTKLSLLRKFIAHSLTPEGLFTEIGDSYPNRPDLPLDPAIEYALSNGAKGSSIPAFKIYNRGYIFGHSGLSSDKLSETREEDVRHYSIRFGPQRIIHGHNDHTSLTYWSSQRRVIVDPGHIGYTPGSDRDYVRSHGAHNVLVAHGKKHDWSTETSLIAHTLRNDWQSFILRDLAYAGIQRDRTICMSTSGPFAVLDHATSNSRVQRFIQRWNLAPEFQFSGSDAESAWFTSERDGLVFYLLRYRIQGDEIHRQTSIELNHGNHKTMLGFVAEGEKLVPNWNIGFSASSSDFCLLTAGWTAKITDKVSWSFRKTDAETAHLKIKIGERSWSFAYSVQTAKLKMHSISK